MPTTCQCPFCNRYLNAPDENLGQQVTCPVCSRSFVARAASNYGVLTPTQREETSGVPVLKPVDDFPEDHPAAPTPRRRRINRGLPQSDDEYVDEYGYDSLVERPNQRPNAPTPGNGTTIALRIFIVLSLIAGVCTIIVSIARFTQAEEIWLDTLRRGFLAAPSHIDQAQSVIFLFSMFIQFFTMICFLVWLYQCRKNLDLLGIRGLRYSPGFGVVTFFIPFANLFLPVIHFQEIWKASGPIDEHNDYDWKTNAGSTAIGIWWILFILCNAAGSFLSEFEFENTDLATIRMGAFSTIIVTIIAMISKAILFMIVGQLRERQEQHLQKSGHRS